MALGRARAVGSVGRLAARAVCRCSATASRRRTSISIRGDKVTAPDGETLGTVVAIDRRGRVGRYPEDRTTRPTLIQRSHLQARRSSRLSSRRRRSCASASTWPSTGWQRGGAHAAASDLLLQAAAAAVRRRHAANRGPGRKGPMWRGRIATSLDRTVLAIQGPPGSGKTYTAARMIVRAGAGREARRRRGGQPQGHPQGARRCVPDGRGSGRGGRAASTRPKERRATIRRPIAETRAMASAAQAPARRRGRRYVGGTSVAVGARRTCARFSRCPGRRRSRADGAGQRAGRVAGGQEPGAARRPAASSSSRRRARTPTAPTSRPSSTFSTGTRRCREGRGLFLAETLATRAGHLRASRRSSSTRAAWSRAPGLEQPGDRRRRPVRRSRSVFTCRSRTTATSSSVARGGRGGGAGSSTRSSRPARRG